MGIQNNTNPNVSSQPTHSGSQPNPSPQASPSQPDPASQPVSQPPASQSGPPPQPGSQGPSDGLQDELVKALVQKALREKEAEFARALKEATGFESLQALREHQLKEQGRLNELLQVKEEEANKYRQRFEQMAIRAQIMAAAQDAVDPEVVLTLLQSKAKVDDQGYVTLDGKTPAEAVAELLKEKPYLAKPSGNQGSGSPQQPASSANEKTMTREQFEQLSPRDQMAFVQNNGRIVDG